MKPTTKPTRNRKTRKQILIINYAILIGVTPLIPIPYLDDWVKLTFQRRFVRRLALSFGWDLPPQSVNLLADSQDIGCGGGCFSQLFKIPLKRFLREVFFFLEWRRAADLVSQSYYYGYLLDYAFSQGWVHPNDPTNLVQIRTTIQKVRAKANLELVKKVVESNFEKSKNLRDQIVTQFNKNLKAVKGIRLKDQVKLVGAFFAKLVPKRWRRTPPVDPSDPSPDAEGSHLGDIEEELEEVLEEEEIESTPWFIALRDRILEGITQLPREHFEELQGRLATELRAGDAT
jgi:hypothetical protein